FAGFPMADFEYKIITKGDFVVTTFKGRISKDCKDSLSTCHQELLSFDSKNIVLYLKDVEGVETSIFRELTLLQQDLRKKNKLLFIVGLNSTLKQFLYNRGVIRLGEVGTSLEEVLMRAV